MRTVVIGTGGIGGPYGASLAKAGADVTFVARGAHLAAIRENGLRVEGDRGETHIRPAQATDDIAGIGPVDFVLFCVKLWDVEAVGAQLRPLIGPQTAVIPLQNGVDAPERLVTILGPDAVVRQTGTYQQMTFGELDGRISARGERLRDCCEAAGFDGVLSPNVTLPIWEKFVMLVPVGGLNALTRLPIGKWRDDPDLYAIYEAALRETVAVGRAEGVPLPAEAVDKGVATMRAMPSYLMASMGHDVIRGNRLELPWFSGKVVELGRRHGVPTPANAFIYAALKPYIDGPPS
jgi:2-dehydropantoate 2-reductase